MLVHPGWHCVVPSRCSITDIYMALDHGDLDLPMETLHIGQRQHKLLRDLTAIPAHQYRSYFIEMTQPVLAGMRSTKDHGDAAHQSALKSAGKPFHFEQILPADLLTYGY